MWRLVRTPAAPLEISGYVLERPRPISPFTLLDADGAGFTNESFEGSWSFLYFGYTYCPDVCPLSLLELAKVKETLAREQPAVEAHYYLVSVDPGRDTPARIREYVAYFDPAFRGLTGEPAEIDKLARAAGAIYLVPPSTAGEPYLVGHSSTITLIDPEGSVHAVFTTPFDAERIAADFASIVARYRASE